MGRAEICAAPRAAGSINSEMIELLGATNVAGKDRGGLANVGLEHHQAPTEEQLTRLLSEPGVAPR